MDFADTLVSFAARAKSRRGFRATRCFRVVGLACVTKITRRRNRGDVSHNTRNGSTFCGSPPDKNTTVTTNSAATINLMVKVVSYIVLSRVKHAVASLRGPTEIPRCVRPAVSTSRVFTTRHRTPSARARAVVRPRPDTPRTRARYSGVLTAVRHRLSHRRERPVVKTETRRGDV